MKSFNSILKNSIKNKNSHLCIGLDISSEGLRDKSATIKDLKLHSRKVIEATQDLAVAFKPNLGFFERWGSNGFKWLEETMDFFEKDTLVIGDAKRGDIGNTANQYAKSLFGHFGFDAVTLSPYMGFDSIMPFISDSKKGVFILCRTSNPSASDFQNIHTDSNDTLFETVARTCHEWNKNENIGLVVGATAAEDILKVRKHAPDLPLLIPGIGKQGGDLNKSMIYGNNNGISIINISRSIIFPPDLSEKSIRNEAKNYLLKMREILDD
ncbi:MAG: orotidine-5'-phosphate decarboxylase [Candidatus Marinimicrobia bacterium]|nr:orotidine-5'-phosphate decarboxylase [Candidatus Neomarinimicrobiota bacterium]|tara:strand:- start:1067 stop:1870 length:804 start_codon:yes stop_codon:yes gene_type:complete